MPKFKVISRLRHDEVEYDEGDVVEFSQELADRCGAVDPVALPEAEEDPAPKGDGKKPPKAKGDDKPTDPPTDDAGKTTPAT